ncbi:hypothetical protein Patl1_20845 [Pistacia atlantica]|uniref:Uncharacterized protein n=1 Tax=Pistacia atlantica TaxID=434234 RepID=A0ACC1BIZ6_9ROSI|nr:hypothetical protein Patl1_20845 [Pistacia atlantica]
MSFTVSESVVDDFARYVFDKMSERNDASWNNLISGLVRLRFYQESFSLFREMLSFGVMPRGVFVASLVTACDRFVADARRVFEEMPNRNVVSWTSLMAAYLECGNVMEVMSIYRHVKCEGVRCDENTLSTVITSCGLIENDLVGYQVLGDVIKFGLENTLYVPNSLISMFGNFGSVKEARNIFQSMHKRDMVSWNSMISVYVRGGLCEKAMRCFYSMRCIHGEINSTTLSSLLSVCGSVDNLKWGRGIHGLVVKLGLDSNVCVCNTLLSMYSEAGRCKDAEFVFREMPERDLFSWNSLIACYVQDGKRLQALEVFSNMLQKQKIHNYVTFTSALAACSDPEFAVQGKIVHALMMPQRDTVSWNALIGGYAGNEEPNAAVEAYKLMKEEGRPMNYITITNVLGACLTPQGSTEAWDVYPRTYSSNGN